MPSVKLSPFFNDAQLDNNGLPFSGARIYWFQAGTSTRETTYVESTGSTPSVNPVVLNARGEPPAPIWLKTGVTYKAVLKDSSDNLIRSIDNISGINDATTPVISEWVTYAAPATYINATTFSVTGNATAIFDNGRRVKTTVSGTDRYGTVNGTPTFLLGVTTVILTLDSGVLDSSIATVAYGFLDPAHPSFDTSGVNLNTKAGIQNQTWTAFTSAGASGAYTLTPNPAISTYSANQRFTVTFNAQSNAAANTIDINGLGPKSIKMYDIFGVKTNAYFFVNQIFDIVYDGTDFILLNALQNAGQIQEVYTSNSSGSLVVAMNPTWLDFRNPSSTIGTISTRNVPNAIGLTVPVTATLGTVSGIQSRLAILAIDHAGTVELAITNAGNGGLRFDETNIIDTVALDSSSDAANVVYSSFARTGVAFRVVGFIDITEAVAGTWSTTPSKVQGAGGNALMFMTDFGYGQTWQDMSSSRVASTTYYNTTGKPIMVIISFPDTGSDAGAGVNVGGVNLIYTVYDYGSNSATLTASFIVPSGASYFASVWGSGSISRWVELR